MTDQRIVELYWEREERAIAETDIKYGGYCRSIAFNILYNHEDTEESVSDTYFRAWNSIPPERPGILSAFLGKICRRLSLDRWRRLHAQKRGCGELPLALDELSECLPSGKGDPAEELELKELRALYESFLSSLPNADRRVFLCRYWYLDSVSDIARRYGFTESKVRSMLHRSRTKFRSILEKEGYR